MHCMQDGPSDKGERPAQELKGELHIEANPSGYHGNSTSTWPYNFPASHAASSWLSSWHASSIKTAFWVRLEVEKYFRRQPRHLIDPLHPGAAVLPVHQTLLA
eukprot:FR735561.1.p2 GENE.FR735561.1~~FR735561.1.p2  ORF type:complete len:103 (-),score=11.14 FR735561.1:295-603(-)